MNARPKINPKLDAVHYWASRYSTSCGIFVLAMLTSAVKYLEFVTLAHGLSFSTWTGVHALFVCSLCLCAHLCFFPWPNVDRKRLQ